MLDDVRLLRDNDPEDMLGHVERFAEHLDEADAGARTALDRAVLSKPTAVVVAGMGGSAIAGDIVRGALADSLAVPMVVSRGYGLSGFVGPGTLVVASSYSGNTEETLAAYELAASRGAQLVCMTTGGRLGELASSQGRTVVPLRPGLPPRASLGFGLVSLLHILASAELIDDPTDAVASSSRAAVVARERFGPQVPTDANEAKGLAVWFATGTPVIYGAEPATAPVATRWAGQLAENGKTVGHANVLPEMNHNEIVGFGDREALGGAARVLFLRDESDHERVARRVAITAGVLSEEGVESRTIQSFGDSRMARLVSLVLAGDYASVYLAALRGVDPTPVEPIDRLKAALAR
jgi:glucose/mannose-6-phosphate isomerase